MAQRKREHRDEPRLHRRIREKSVTLVRSQVGDGHSDAGLESRQARPVPDLGLNTLETKGRLIRCCDEVR